MESSFLEQTFLFQCQALRIPQPQREYRFDKLRRWRFDFCWPAKRVAVEVEGGLYVRGRHMRIGGFEADCEKYNAAALQGWKVLRFTPKAITSGQALDLVVSAISAPPEPLISAPEPAPLQT